MSGKPASGTVLGTIGDLAEPGAKLSDWENGRALIIRREGKLCAWINECPHAGLPMNLPSGKVMLHKDGFIVCPVHGASFDAETGACVGGPAAGDSLDAIAVEQVGDEVRVK